MGFIANLLGINNSNVPQLGNSIYPAGAVAKVQSGTLPIIQVDKLVLKTGEVCHYVDVAIRITEKVVRHTKRVGGAYRIIGGLYASGGESVSTPISQDQYTKGYLYITNKRIIFTSKTTPMEQQINKITAITPYTDGVDIQCGNKTYIFFVPNGSIFKRTIDLIV